MIYETEVMDFYEAQKFEQWFDKIIGTECEVNADGGDMTRVYFVCVDLTAEEVEKIRDFENNRRK